MDGMRKVKNSTDIKGFVSNDLRGSFNRLFVNKNSRNDHLWCYVFKEPFANKK